MYPYSNSFLTEWNKTIIYAPNGFGKTTNSIKMADELRKDGKKVKLFTNKSLEDLIDEFNDEFFLGSTAKMQTKKKRIEESIEKAKPFVAGLGAKSLTAAVKSSFVLMFYHVTKASDKPKLIKKNVSRIMEKYADYDNSVIESIDVSLDYALYLDIKSFIDKYDAYDKIEKDELDDLYVDQETKDNIFSILLYSKLNHFKTCLLCGKSYRNYNSLIRHIENHYSQLKIIENENAVREMNSLVKRLILFKGKTDNPIIKKTFNDIELNTSKRKSFIALKLYIQLCMDNVFLMSNKIGEITIPEEDDTIFGCLAKINKLESKIDEIDGTTNKDLEKINKFNVFVVNEIKSIIHPDDDINILPLDGKKGFTFKINNKKQSAKEFLSTSEFKRLVLVTLYAEIYFSDTDALILDDPIDSYDDYTKLLAIKYIKKILRLRRLHNWYILTNDFECVYNLSEIQKCDVIFYLADPDYVYNGSSYNYWHQKCTNKEVKKIGKNDLYFLVDFITTKKTAYSYDPDLMFCAMSLPLRNINTEVIKKLKYLEIVTKTGKIDACWSNEVKEKIVSCFEHYRSNNYFMGTNMDRSNTLTIASVASLYVKTHNSNKNMPSAYNGDSRLMVTYRKNVAKRPFNSFRNNKYSDVINYIFLKALMIETIKFEFEKKVVDKGYSYFSPGIIDAKMKKAFGLQSIISTISLLNKSTPVHGINTFVERCQQIHDDFSVMYNAIDHATTMMISPYLSISLRDIKSFKDRVDSL